MERSIEKVNKIIESLIQKNLLVNGHRLVSCDWSDKNYVLTTVGYCADNFIITFEQYYQMLDVDETKIYASVAIKDDVNLDEKLVLEDGKITLDILIKNYLQEFSSAIVTYE